MIQGLKKGSVLKGGTYCIEKVLGQGSFGITYLATAKFTTQGNLGSMDVEAKVAIKEFFMSEVNGRSEDGSTVDGSTGSVFSNYRKKFRKEAENLSKLKHPNIVKVFDVFDENNTTYYVMEFLEGQNLDDYIKQCGNIEEHEAIQIISEIGGALSYMHSKKMLHLDIKPNNIMRKYDGKYYLIDFGLSKQFTNDGEPESSTSIGLGTPGYAPIEQAGYKQEGSFPATLDVYALGATLFKMLMGKRPPEATYILNEGFPEKELISKGITENTRTILKKAMAPTKKHRFQTVKSFIDEFAEETTIVDPNPKPKSKTGHKLKPKLYPIPISIKWIWWVGVIAVVILGFVIIWKINHKSQPINYAIEAVELSHSGETSTKESVDESYGSVNGHDWVDLGLSVKWAKCNVGATKPSDYGNYYAWGETSPKSTYTWSNCFDCLDDSGDSWDIYKLGGKTQITPTSGHDTARENWGGAWRMPTDVEFDELNKKCKWDWTTKDGHAGYLVTGPNGNSIFLPAAGYRNGADAYDMGEYGSYWSSTLGSYSNDAHSLNFDDGYHSTSYDDRSEGQSVRPVKVFVLF